MQASPHSRLPHYLQAGRECPVKPVLGDFECMLQRTGKWYAIEMQKGRWILLVCSVLQAVGAIFVIFSFFGLTPGWWKTWVTGLTMPGLLSVVPWVVGSLSTGYAFYVLRRKPSGIKNDGKQDERTADSVAPNSIVDTLPTARAIPLSEPILEYKIIEGDFGFLAGLHEEMFSPLLLTIWNSQRSVDNTANNVRASMEYIHASGDRFTFDTSESLWLVKITTSGSRFKPTVFIRGGDTATLLFLGQSEGKSWYAIAKSNMHRLQIGKWTIRISIEADNCGPLCGTVGFIVCPDNRLEWDSPAFQAAKAPEAAAKATIS